jgi:uncharacterized protein
MATEMVDYYLLLSQALAGIPSSMPGAREALYDRARKILAADLEKVPTVIEAEFAAEKRSLEEAIARIEHETHRPSAAAPNQRESQDAALFIQTPATQDPSKRPTLSELLRRVDDAMKEPALAAAEQAAARAAPAPEKRMPEKRAPFAPLLKSPTLANGRSAAASTPLAARSWGTSTTREPMLPPPKPRPSLAPSRLRPAPPPSPTPAPASGRTGVVGLLKDFQQRSPGMEASALISRTGRMIASVMAPQMDEARVAGVTATLLNLCGRAARELNRGDVREVIVRADYGYAVVVGAGEDSMLLALANESSQLGYIFFCMQETIQALEKLA